MNWRSGGAIRESFTVDEILRLQQSAGNQAVLWYLHRIRGIKAVPGEEDKVGFKEVPQTGEVVDPKEKQDSDVKPDLMSQLVQEAPRAEDRIRVAVNWLNRLAKRMRLHGLASAARVIEAVAAEMDLQKDQSKETSFAHRTVLEACLLAADPHGRTWGRANGWRWLSSYLIWLITFGRLGGPWLNLTATEYGRFPSWQRKDAAFVAEVIFKANGLIHRARRKWFTRINWYPYRPQDWWCEETVITGYQPRVDPIYGDIWSDGSRAGIVLGGSGDVWLGIAPEEHAGKGWSIGSGLTLVRLKSDVRYKRYDEK